MKNQPRAILTGLALAALQQGCDSGASTASEDATNARPYVMGFRIETDDDGTTADYVLTASDISKGELSVEGKGIEQVGWRYMGALGKTLYSIGYYDDNNFVVYELDASGKLAEKDRVVFQTTIDVVGDADETTLLAMEVPRKTITPRTWHVFDLENVSIAKKVVDSIYVDHADSLVPWPTALVRRGDKVFVPFYQLHARGDFSTPHTDTAFLAVYSWPGLVQEKVIKDTRMGPIGLYGDRNGAILTASGDLYAMSTAAKAAGFTTTQKKSGILRVKAGSTEFDPSYHWDIEAASGGNKIVWFAPVGGEKALVRLSTDDSELWGAYGNFVICKLAVADLAAKTLTMVDDIPLHRGGYGGNVFMEDGKAWVSLNTGTESCLWAVDPATAKAVKGAKIKGYEIPVLLRP
jgi:hypothetical protein